MNLNLEQIRPGDLDEVVAFLRTTFRAPLDAPFLQTDHVRWKFFEPRPDWDGPRSYVFREQGRIVAHACVVPTTFVMPDGAVVRSLFPIDWAASPSVPGAGILLLKDLTALADIRMGYGGSADTRAIVRKGHNGKKHPYEQIIGEVIHARRIFRPWSPLKHRTEPAWRALAKAGLRTWQNTLRPLRSVGDWAACPVDRFDDRLPNLHLRGNPTGLALPFRTPELLNYILRCPSVRFSGFLLEKSHRVGGHFLLADLGEEVRLADLMIDSDAVGDWAACYTLAVLTAKQYYPRGGHLVAVAAPSSLQAALYRAGFTVTQRAPLIVQDKCSFFASAHPPVVNMIDSDSAYFF
jgi:hypothetical protein